MAAKKEAAFFKAKKTSISLAGFGSFFPSRSLNNSVRAFVVVAVSNATLGAMVGQSLAHLREKQD